MGGSVNSTGEAGHNGNAGIAKVACHSLGEFHAGGRSVAGADYCAVGVVIVEAARRSGSLITARLAAEQGREVFAVPGSPLDPRSEGTNGLLKQGAPPVTDASDVIAAIEPILGRSTRPPSAQEPPHETLGLPDTEPGEVERKRIIALLGPSPVSIDDLVRLSHTHASIVRTVLLELEMAGRLERHGAGLVFAAVTCDTILHQRALWHDQAIPRISCGPSRDPSRTCTCARANLCGFRG